MGSATSRISNHHGLMFELISRRYQNRSNLVTTSRNFAEWREVFPNAACVVSLVDRLLHNSEIVAIEGNTLPPQGSNLSYRTARTTAPRRQIMSTPPDRPQLPEHLLSAHRCRDPPPLDTEEALAC